MSLKHTVFAVVAGLLAASSQAQVAVTADLGTLGAGVHVVLPMETYLNGRFGVNYAGHDFNKTSNSVKYDLKGKLQTVDVLFDWYLRQDSAFRLTGGLVYNATEVKAKASANAQGEFTLNGKTYTAADVGVLSGTVDFRKAAPYIGIGWGNALRQGGSGWQFSADLGAMYTGKAEVRLVSIGCTTSNTVCRALATDVEAERARFEKEASDFQVYPVVRASLSYRF